GRKRFGRRYDLPSLPLPQTLTVLPGGKSSAQMIVYGTKRGTEVARARQELSFRSGSVLHVDVPLDACQPHASSGRFSSIAAPTAESVDAVALVPGANAATAGDLALALASGRSTPAAAAGDVDGDGAVDIVAVGGTSAHVWLNDGAGHFREGSAGLDVAPTDATVVALADLDGDGNLDLILGQGSATAAVARVYLNDK